MLRHLNKPTETNLSDIAGNANEGAIVVANDLGVVTGYPDGTFKPTALVTRAEFAAMMTRALAIPESALKGFKTSSFKDVASDHWAVAYLGYCNSKGIMTGYEDGTARPNQTITVNEAMTMLCRALGYTNQAKELVGAWPANYISLGQTLGLYSDVEAVATTDRASAAQMIYNALDKDLVYINADGDTVRQVVKEGNVALGIATVYNSMLLSLGGNDQGETVLTYQIAKTAIVDVTKYIGAYVNYWTNDDGELIAVKVLSTTLADGEYNAAKGELKVDDVVYYLAGGDARYTNPLAPNGAKLYPEVFINGQEQGDVVAAATTPNNTSYSATYIATGSYAADIAAALEEDTPILNVKLSGKKITEVYSVMFWDRGAAMGLYEEGDLNVEKCKITVDGQDYDFIKDNNGNIDTTTFTLLGVSSLGKIAVDNVVEVYLNDQTGKIAKIEVGTKTVKGEITEVNKDGNKFTIDGTKYKVAAGCTDPIDVGDTGTAYLTYGGKIAKWDVEDSITDNYAVYLGVDYDNDPALNTSTVTKFGLCLKDGTVKSYALTKNCYLDTTTNAAIAANGVIVNYSLNTKGELSKIKFLANEAGTAALNGKKLNVNKDGIGSVSFAKGVVVFLQDGDKWSIGEVKNIDTDYAFNTNPDWIVKDGKGKIAAIRMSKDDATGHDEQFGVINSVSMKNNSGDKTWYVNGLVDGVALAAFTDNTDPTDVFYKNSNFATFGVNSLYHITVDTDGTVSGCEIANGTGLVTIAGVGVERTNASIDTTGTYAKVVTTQGGAEYTYFLAKDVVVYSYDKDEEEFVKKDVKAIGKGKDVVLFRTKKDNNDDNLFDVVLVTTVD